jgi:hypothetical protein
MTAPRCYLVPEESLLYASRRHVVMLGSSTVTLIVGLALAVALWVEAPHRPTGNLRELGLIVAGAAVVYFAWHTWRWWLGRYVVTDKRIIHVEGLLSRRIKSLPLRLVIDTTYHRTLPGRLLGYCDLELNLSGQPGLRRLTRVPHGDRVYRLILQLLNSNEGARPAVAGPGGGAEAFPEGRRRRRGGAGPVRSSRARDGAW